MGICASTKMEYTRKKNYKATGMRVKAADAAQVIHWDGRLEEVKQPLKAGQILSRSPKCFLCWSESMFVGAHPPQLVADDDLQLGQIYFLLPLSHSRAPLSLSNLCVLAIKASSALSSSSCTSIYGCQGYCCEVSTLNVNSSRRPRQ